MNVYDKPKYLVAGDSAVVVEFGNAIDPTVNNLVNQLMLNIDNKRPDGVLDMVPSYRSLMIYYDPLINSFEQLVNQLKEIKGLDNDFSKREFRTVEIPTLYGGLPGELGILPSSCLLRVLPQNCGSINMKVDGRLFCLGEDFRHSMVTYNWAYTQR